MQFRFTATQIFDKICGIQPSLIEESDFFMSTPIPEPVTNSKSSAQSYDAIIFGAGIAGLTAAAYLALGGARVLVCEQAAKVGGLFNTFERDGFWFDGGIKAIENSGLFLSTLKQLGMQDRITVHKSPIGMITNGKMQLFNDWQDVENYYSDLQVLFPGEQKGLLQVKADSKAIFDLLDSLLTFPIPIMDTPADNKSARSDWFKQRKGSLARFPKALAMMKKEMRTYLEEHIHDPNLVNLLCDLFPDGTSAFFGLGYFRMFLDYYYPEGGMQSIPSLLAEGIIEKGVEVRLNTRVERILLQDGKACGVRLESGEELKAGYVLASSDLNQALTRMIPEGILPVKFEQKMRSAQVSHSVFNVFLGLDVPPEYLNLSGSGHVFYNPDLEGITEQDRISREDYFAHVPQEISVPCMHDPKLAPAGMTGLNLSAMTSHKFLGGWMKDDHTYDQLKEACADDLIRSFEKYCPDLSKHIVFRLTSTPRTILLQTSNHEGAIMGWSYHRKEAFNRGSLLALRSIVKTPVPRLLTAGQWTFAPGGAPTALLTGRLAADHVLKNLKTE